MSSASKAAARIGLLKKASVRDFLDGDCLSMAAARSHYTIFSLRYPADSRDA